MVHETTTLRRDLVCPTPFEAIDILDTPPGSPANEDTYLVDSAPTGAWTGHANEVAIWDATATAWHFCTAEKGAEYFVTTKDNYYYINDSLVWTPRPSAVGKIILTPIITPPALTENTHNWNPTGLSTATVIRASCSGNRDLTGIVAQVESSGFRGIYLLNIGSDDIKLKNENSNSLAANRFACGADRPVNEGEGVMIIYDNTSARWMVLTIST